ncbi:S-layer homology domain-containing protein [Lysinibacillus piscis]|uniref:Glucosaminidase n=1 Tax=Lysinibacillus piscis TaxID=2518931 RepID=A0ABQ5NHL2_9BACI|nr:S-layer homology domain-containing protein [Lysinibacillus sp. KH24]GLC87855.1 glucosaminidase [Lysinibacillus sp. KH24]
MKKLSIIMTLMISICFLGWQPSQVFADELTGHTHEQGLRYLISKNALMQDVKGSYRPGDNVTRGEFASYLAKSLALPTKNTIDFTDVPDTYLYAKDIQLAASAGIITGYVDGSFKPDTAISRQHMAVMLERAINYLHIPKGSTTIKFKDEASIIKDYRSAVATGAQLGIIVGSDGHFMPTKNATIGQAATFIYRLMQLQETPPEELPTPIPPAPTPTPPVEVPAYMVKSIVNGELVGTQGFTSFEEASKAASQATQVIVVKDKIMKMTAGYAVTNNYVTLNSESLKDQIAIAANTEMEYISSDATQVKVNIAGHIGYVKQTDVTLIPFAMSKGRSYYSNENGEIKHTLYDYTTNKYNASYTYGKAPAFMQKGEKYYSWDGIHFSLADGSPKGEVYNYYQFLPIRSKTQYTAEEIDAYIMTKLTELESSGLSIYKDATTKSKLIGLGSTLKQLEEASQINALLILSMAQHESLYGLSDHAQNLNNLFGLYVFDVNPLNKNFDSIAANISELVEKFLQPNYIQPGGSPGRNFANGAVIGSKAVGFNVKYASDPFWGAKIAGHYYRIDKALGFKDANNPYTIGFTTTTGLNVRTDASTTNSPLFKYSRSGMPVIITNTDVNGWYEVLSDQLTMMPVYIHKDYIRIVETVK